MTHGTAVTRTGAVGTHLEDTAPAAVIDHPSGFLCLSARNQQFTLPGIHGFVAYREYGRHRFCLGGVHARSEHRPQLLDAMLADTRRRGREMVVVQVPVTQVELFRSRGFSVSALGATFAISLSDFSLAGAKKMKLRNKIKRAREVGVRISEAGRDVPSDEALFDELHAVSENWIAAKHKKELDFMVGEIGKPADPDRRIFVARDQAGKLCGFISYVRAYGSRPGFLHDLTRKVPDAPVGVMELCNAEAISRFREEGVLYLHLGFTPFVSTPNPFGNDGRVLAWVIRMLEKYGEPVYPTKSQVDYKKKWGPDVIEPEFIAFSRPSVRAVLDLLFLTRSL